MSNRIYNILFHSHTISGIIISALLYVIFFTGSITFLRDEINAWERNEPIGARYFNTVPMDTIFQALEKDNQLYGRDVSITRYYDERRLNVSMSVSQDTTLEMADNKRAFFYIDGETTKTNTYKSGYSLGEFFYRLHFFAQLNFYGRSGYLLAGLVAFFFLFAIMTGVLVHWKKIVPNFFVFRPKAKWKTIWTDAHVGLGILGLPYQFMFAVTGAYLIIGYSLMMEPVKKFLFDGNQEKMFATMDFDGTETYEFQGKPTGTFISIDQYIDQTLSHFKNTQFRSVEVFNYGDRNMHVKVNIYPEHHEKFLGSGYLVFHGPTGDVTAEKDPFARTSYMEGAVLSMLRLHLGDFGGYGMKLIYLVLGFISCFVILSGVLIWRVARDKKQVDPRKRKFNKWLVHVYVAICLSLYPTTAFSFCAVKWLGEGVTDNRQTLIYDWFFWPWFILSLFLIWKQNDRFTTRACLTLGSVLGFLVPLVNGIISGNWLWKTFRDGYTQIFVVDLFWILLSLTALFVLVRMQRPKDTPKTIPTAQPAMAMEEQILI